jgi:hypothetical protein
MSPLGVQSPSGLSPDDVRTQLDAILGSEAFSSSKRCQEFLRYVVLESLEGRADGIKERTIASDVFGKSIAANSDDDSLVRVKAREVRKRLAAYYELEPDAPICIELPLGGYAPRFGRAARQIAISAPVAVPQIVHPPGPKRNRQWALLAVFALASIAVISYWLTRDTSVLHRFWLPVLKTNQPLVIFVPQLLDRNDHELSDRVGLGAAQAAVGLAAEMTRLGHPYIFKIGQDLTFSDLKRQPSVLLGGFSSFWTLEMSRGLRFNLVQEDYQRVVDTKTKQEWRPVGVRAHGFADEDYGIVCRLLDSKSGQIMMIAAGTTTFGTLSAAEVLLEPALLANLVSKGPPDWESRNFEAVIHTSIIGDTPGPPNVVASYFW